jgi:hypothetical protein
MKFLRQLYMIATMLCVSCTSSPVVGYRAGTSDDSLVVTQEFQYTVGPSSASRMEHTWTLPAGVYHALGTDDSGTYYVAPAEWIRLKARFADRPFGGLYRRGDRFYVFTQATIDIVTLWVGSKPYIWDEVPREFRKFIEHR